MRFLRNSLIFGLTFAPLPAFAAEAPTTAPTPPAAQSAVQPPSQPTAADQISAAATPSETVAVYARLSAGQPNDISLEQAYVHRMVGFGMPELAETQAHDLVQHNVNDGVAIGVGAYMSATKGEYGAAVQQLKMALMQSPNDAFLVRTAGQTVAWYDGQSDRSKLTPTDVAALEWIRSNNNGRPGFAEAYRAASQPAATNGNAATAPPTTTPAVSETSPTSPYAYGGYGVPSGGTYPGTYDAGTSYVGGYGDPYYYTPNYTYSSPYYYSSGYYPYGYFGAGFVIVDNGHHHDHDHGHDHDHDHGDFHGHADPFGPSHGDSHGGFVGPRPLGAGGQGSFRGSAPTGGSMNTFGATAHTFGGGGSSAPAPAAPPAPSHGGGGGFSGGHSGGGGFSGGGGGGHR